MYNNISVRDSTPNFITNAAWISFCKSARWKLHHCSNKSTNLLLKALSPRHYGRGFNYQRKKSLITHIRQNSILFFWQEKPVTKLISCCVLNDHTRSIGFCIKIRSFELSTSINCQIKAITNVASGGFVRDENHRNLAN